MCCHADPWHTSAPEEQKYETRDWRRRFYKCALLGCWCQLANLSQCMLLFPYVSSHMLCACRHALPLQGDKQMADGWWQEWWQV